MRVWIQNSMLHVTKQFVPQSRNGEQPRKPRIGLLGCTLLVLTSGVARAAILPPGFSKSVVAGDIARPTAMDFAPDGRLFVCQQDGQVRVIKNDVLPATPFLSVAVDPGGERGLLGVAFDPRFASSANDPEDGDLPPSAFSWTIVFHHADHTHPFLGPIANTTNGTFTIPTSGETSANVFYRVHLTVTDSAGAQSSASVDILPNVVTLVLVTEALGVQVTLDGQPVATPTSCRAWLE